MAVACLSYQAVCLMDINLTLDGAHLILMEASIPNKTVSYHTCNGNIIMTGYAYTWNITVLI